MGMGAAGMDTDMTTTEAVGIMKEDKRCFFQGRGVVSNTIFKRYSAMKRYIRAICIIGFAFITIIGAGSFSAASADGYYYGHRDHHYRYRRAYDHCAYRYRVDSYRFQRCMDYHLEEYRRW
jgi:hypothetical protein